MLTIEGRRLRLCDRIARRDFLAIGSLALGGLSLPQLLRAEQQSGIGHSHKAIIDLHERGLDRDVSVVVWGEFGRTPKVNKDAGRDHWPGVMFALLAGGGMRTGQVIGATNRFAEEAITRPVYVHDVFATLYHNLGIDLSTTTIPDLAVRVFLDFP